jgi:hypothetical protein
MNRRILIVLTLAACGAAAAESPGGGTPSPAPPGSVEAGRALFAGSTPFRNGGAPCGACHALAGEGLAVTASLGPELSTALSGMDAEMLDGILEGLPTPTMTPVYEGKGLTPGERADVAAYLVEAVKRGPPPATRRFELLGAAGALLLLVPPALAWRRRKSSSRARLLAGARALQRGAR